MSAKAMYHLLAMMVAAILLAACNGGAEEALEESPPATGTAGETASPVESPTSESEVELNVELAAENQVPEAGDREMSGSGTVRLNPETGEVCPEIDIEKPEATSIRAAHIHRGAAGTNGPVVVPFEADEVEIAEQCVTAEQSLVNEIQQDPSSFYVNVHTAEFPDGAIRGQLSAG